MAEIKKYLDTTALETLVAKIKSEDDAHLAAAQQYADGLAKNYDAAGAAATAKSEAIADADAKFTVVNENVAKKADTTALEAEVTRATTKEGELSTAIDGVEAKADKNAEDIVAINNETTGILAQAKADATEKANAVQENVDALAEKVGEVPEDQTVMGIITNIQENAYDDTALKNRIAAVETNKADKTQVATDIASAKTELEGKITAEETARTQADEGLAERIKVVEDDYLKVADKTELTNAIATAKEEVVATILGEGVDEDFDTLKEVADWILSDTTGAAALQTDVATLKEEMDAVEADVEQAKKDIDAVEGAVATKAEKTYVDEAVEALQGEDTAIKGRLDALEGAIGESGSVADDIATAKQEAITAAATDSSNKDAVVLAEAQKYADNADAQIEATIAELTETVNGKAAQSEVNTISGKVGTLETKVGTLETEMDAVELKAAANETAIGTINTELAKKAAQTDLDNAVARIAANETAIATKASDADLDDAVERIAANEEAISNHADLIAANTSAIGSFTPITSLEVEALFA